MSFSRMTAHLATRKIHRDSPHHGSGRILRAESISKRFAGVQALKSVDFALERGDLLGLIGPNGSGKTTLVNILSGFYSLTDGRVLLDSLDISGWSSHQIARAGVCRTFQNVRLFNRLTVLENVEVGAAGSRTKLRGKAMRQHARDALAELEISSYADRYASELPYGTQRRVEMARAIASDPDLLLLDEPAAGLNRAETEALSQTITELHATRELGVLVIDHDLRMITSLCKRIVVLDVGSVIAAGTPQEVTADPAVIAAYIGTSSARERAPSVDHQPAASRKE
jgi:branched-chain amino acid transport system ATP-binding protein/branched-chain amino acid transport system permease protein